MKLIKHLPYELTTPFIEIYSRKIRIYVSQKQIMDAYRGYIDVSLKLETTQIEFSAPAKLRNKFLDSYAMKIYLAKKT